ncbi:hypothetical protein [Limnohabitans sp.]|uniref:beta strand repeat-containing protein n=1 Tax=Limnohabitans sp. TaxID=1907725 RepID=UPI0025B7E019|nr:hypothetical protein [Limnohabitans sp.]
MSITGKSLFSDGINVGNKGAAQVIAAKNIKLDGKGASGGVRTWAASLLTAGSTGSGGVLGDITILGEATTGSGVIFQQWITSARLKASNNIDINGTVTGGAGSGSGVQTLTSETNGQSVMFNADGKFTMTATNSNAANTNKTIDGTDGMQVKSIGDISINAKRETSTGNAIYFYSQANGVGGNASFKSTNGDVLIQANKGGIVFQNAYTGTPSFPYTSSTDISGRNITIDNTGGNVTVNATTGKATLAVGDGTSTTSGINLDSIAGINIDATKNINLSGKSTGAAGVLLGGRIKVRADGDVDIKGMTTSSAAMQGVYLSGVSSVEGKNVDIEGNAFNGNGVLSYAAIKATADGSAKIIGTSTGTGGSAAALSLWATVTADQNVTLKGENTNTANTPAAVFTNKAITATNGKIDVTAITKGSSANSLQLDGGASLIAATEINLKADTLSISNAATINAGVGAGKVTITTDSADAKINIGNGTGTGVSASGVDAGSTTTGARTLGLSNVELNRITAGNLVIGDASNAGGITVSAVTSTNATTGNVTLQTVGNIAINAPLTVGTTTDRKNLELKAGGGQIAQAANATITANQLNIQAAQANVALAAATNQVNQLAANVKSLDFKNGKAIQIGVDATGITASGRIKVETTMGDLTLNQAVTSSVQNISDAVTLIADVSRNAGDPDGANIVKGSNGSVRVGGGSTAKLYTGSIDGSIDMQALAGGAGSGRYRYNSDEATTNFSKALEAGVNVIYREAPEVTVKVSDVNKVYDGVAHSGGSFSSTSTAVGLKNGDTDALVGSNAKFEGNAQGVKDVLASAGKTISALDEGKNALGYKVTYTDGKLSITPRPLTIAVGTVTERPADGTTTATVTPGALGNLVAGENLGVSAVANFIDANAGNGKIVTASYTLENRTNGLASNYILNASTPNPDSRLRGNITTSIKPNTDPYILPVNNNTGSRVRTVSGFGGAGAATGVLDDKAVTESREVCSDVFPENCECQPSVIPSIEICFAPKSVAATKEEK